MLAQLGRAPLASLPAPAFGTGDAVARPVLWAPHNVLSDRELRRSLAYARFLSMSSVGRRSPFAMAEDVAGAAFLFAAAWGNLQEILAVKMASPAWWKRARLHQRK